MLVADTYLGHRDEEHVAERLAESAYHRVVLSDTDRRRSRVRTTTDDGTDLGVVVARDLADGDVLETEAGELVVVELAAVDALVLDFSAAEISPTAALEIGHTLGNKHWNLAVRGETALFPVRDSHERMDAAVADLLPDDVATRYESVPPTTFDSGGTDHDHTHGETAHGHADGDHSHSHGVRTIGGEDR